MKKLFIGLLGMLSLVAVFAIPSVASAAFYSGHTYQSIPNYVCTSGMSNSAWTTPFISNAYNYAVAQGASSADLSAFNNALLFFSGTYSNLYGSVRTSSGSAGSISWSLRTEQGSNQDLVACVGEITVTVAALPTVTTPTSASITTTGATLGANVTSLGIPASISARGTCWGTTTNPTTNCTAASGLTTGVFTHARTGMTCGTTYYYRGYATNTTGTGYSTSASFTTSACVSTYSLTVNSTGLSAKAITASPTTYNGTTPYTKTNITSGTSITLTAPAVSGYSVTWSGTGCSSATASVTTSVTTNRTCSADYTVTSSAPTTPTGVAATAGSCGTGTINVSWTAVSGATSYTVRDGTTVLSTVSGTSYAHTGLVAGSAHAYNVRANNAAGSSAYSSPNVSRNAPSACASAPTTPTGLTATAGSCGTGTINVSWTAVSSATSYTVRDGTTVLSTVSGTSFAHTGLVAGSSHSYNVRANNSAGSSAYSSSVAGTAPSLCSTPYSATCESITAPATVSPGQTFTGTIVMGNTGSNTWTTANNYKLGSQNPSDNTIWGVGRVALPGSIATGGTATFSRTFTAPATLGTYSFAWRMLQEGVTWFGETCSQNVTVSTPVTYNLTTAISPAGSGTITSNPAGISCGADCTESYTSGELVTLTATQVGGYSFVDWTGACAGQTSSCTINMDAAKSTTANFSAVPPPTNIVATCNVPANGQVTVSWSGSAPAYFFRADNNSGDACPPDAGEVCAETVSSSYTFSPTMGVSYATWVHACTSNPCSYSSYSGAISTTFNCSLPLPTVTLTANPTSILSGSASTLTWSSITNADSCTASGSWSGAKAIGGGSESTGNLSSTQTYTLTCTGPGGSTPDSATVTVTPSSYTLTAVINAGLGTITSSPAGIDCPGDCSQSYSTGSSVTLTADPANGYKFDDWGPGGPCNNSTNPICSNIVMNSTQTAKANFSVSPEVSVSCSVTHSTPALIGQTVVWTATPSGGVPPFTFEWSGTNISSLIPPTTNPFTKVYSTIGQKTANVVVTDSVGTQGTCALPTPTVYVYFDPSFEEF